MYVWDVLFDNETNIFHLFLQFCSSLLVMKDFNDSCICTNTFLVTFYLKLSSAISYILLVFVFSSLLFWNVISSFSLGVRYIGNWVLRVWWELSLVCIWIRSRFVNEKHQAYSSYAKASKSILIKFYEIYCTFKKHLGINENMNEEFSVTFWRTLEATEWPIQLII